MPKFFRLALVALLFVALAAIRFFHDELFDNQLGAFFEQEFSFAEPPQFDVLKIIGQVSLRFLLNSLISIVIIFLLFKDTKMLRFAALLYAIAYILLMPLMAYLMYHLEQGDYFFLFYTRRFLVQPVLIIILIPAFYYQKILAQQKNKK